MKKFKINKIVCLTLCFIVLSSVVASATTVKQPKMARSYSACEMDPKPDESNPPF